MNFTLITFSRLLAGYWAAEFESGIAAMKIFQNCLSISSQEVRDIAEEVSARCSPHMQAVLFRCSADTSWIRGGVWLLLERAGGREPRWRRHNTGLGA